VIILICCNSGLEIHWLMVAVFRSGWRRLRPSHLIGFLGGLLIEIIVGLIAGAVFSADHPAAFSWHFLGSLPGLGALLGAVVAPILYARGGRGPAS
jgi:hypothetical protein